MDEIVIPRGFRERLEDIGVARRDAWKLVGVAASAALVAFLLWGRGAQVRVAPPATSVTPIESPIAGAPVVVHVAGAVRRPGLYEVVLGSRVADAIEAAGGPTRAASLDALNLAAEVADAMKIEVPRRGQPVAAPSGTPAATVVDLNTADAAALEQLPGVGPVTAAAIISYRDEAGGFSTVEELLEVDGIGPATLEELRPHIGV